jgi:hypothetical protein
MPTPRCDVTNEPTAAKEMATLSYNAVTREQGTWMRRAKTLRIGKKVLKRILDVIAEERAAHANKTV